MKTLLAWLCVLAALPALAETRFPATLAGHAILAADATVPPPPDAPPGFALSGRWANPERLRAKTPGAFTAQAGPEIARRPTGFPLPLRGQPAGGIASLAAAGDGAYWALGDAGFAERGASPDVLLRLHRLRPDWTTGTVAIERTQFLADPAATAPFHIVTDPSSSRYLTGADFDPAGLVATQDGFWVADRAGPTLLDFDPAARLRDGFELRRDDVTWRTLSRPALAPPIPEGSHAVQAGGGFAGIAATPGGRALWVAFALPIRDGSEEGTEEDTVRLFEFDLASRDWTGRDIGVALTRPGLAIGGLLLLDDRRALLIERDPGEGDAARRCGRVHRFPDCFPLPAAHKRLVLIDLGQVTEGYAKRLASIDLLDIADPEGRARQRGDRAADASEGRFALPFTAIGGIALAGPGEVVLVNDNDVGFAAGRHLARADDTEFVLLRVPELLAAR